MWVCVCVCVCACVVCMWYVHLCERMCVGVLGSNDPLQTYTLLSHT